MQLLIKAFTYLLLLISFLSSGGCKKDLMPDNNTLPEIKLTVEDVGVTEAWLNLEVRNKTEEIGITIFRNDSVIQTFNILTSFDTLIYDSGLLPNHNYTYKATLLTSNQYPVTSIQQLTSMDTTSQDFTWQTWNFGAQSSSIFYDVAIISDDDIWAVGEIYTEDTYTYDSLGNWVYPYNVVHWDGSAWNLCRIKTNSCGGVQYPPIESIFVLSDATILFAHIDASITRYNGSSFINDCSFIQQINGSINKIWGVSKDDYYIVGSEGLIAHYNGGSWQRIESGTVLEVYDIFGQYDILNNENIIYSVAAYQLHSFDKKIFEIKNMNVIDLPTDPIPSSLHGIWFKPPYYHYVAGSGIYKKSDIYSNKPWEPVHYGVSNYYIYSIDGSNVNDIVMCGSYGELLHFNGKTWKSFRTLFSMDNGDFKKINIKDNIIIAVGCKNSQAVIVKGTR